MMLPPQVYSAASPYRHALMGVSDYDWSNLPPLRDPQKEQVATIVDGFKTKEDVQAWANANAGKVEAEVFAAVVGAADQKKLVDLAASTGIREDVQRSIDWAKSGYQTFTPPPPESSATGWLLPIGIAAAAFFALRK